MEVKDKLESREDFIFLDVRSPDEWRVSRIEAPQTRLLPLGELRTRLDELPKDTEIIIFCRSSIRAYQAQRILEGAGFNRVKFMEGSISAWPYKISGNR
jgi:rhodanese-related sulfurtransferase